MNAIDTPAVAQARLDARREAALARARLYSFFELALAHPAPDGLAYFRDAGTGAAFAAAARVADLDAVGGGADMDAAARRFFDGLGRHDDAQAEAAHIALFSAGFPVLPCPPYGSLFLVEGDKRLEEMRRIKECYQQHGFDLDEGFTDLPDHLCVELEFMQALCFREHESWSAGDEAAALRARDAQAAFLGRFLCPFTERILRAAMLQKAHNVYAELLTAADGYARAHLRSLEAECTE